MIDPNLINSPTLLLDETKCRHNIKLMADKAREHEVRLKPHFKTHQSVSIGRWFRDEGINAITVSSVKMATYFANAGWQDITIAFPVNIREMEKINDLASEINLSLLISDSLKVEKIDKQLKHSAGIYVEIDTGSNRTGLKISQIDKIEQIVELLNSSDKLSFKGFYSHPGHSYASNSKKQVLKVHYSVLKQVKLLKDHFSASSKDYVFCIGDTPCCTLADSFENIDEISPGNFVFYDLMQCNIGAAVTEHIAVALVAPVVAKYPDRMELVIHGGAIHLSKDTVKHNDNLQIFGFPVSVHELGWEEPVNTAENYVKSLSQEHGIVHCTRELFKETHIGDLLGILPVHSCLTADCMQGYTTLDGKNIDHLKSQ